MRRNTVHAALLAAGALALSACGSAATESSSSSPAVASSAGSSSTSAAGSTTPALTVAAGSSATTSVAVPTADSETSSATPTSTSTTSAGPDAAATMLRSAEIPALNSRPRMRLANGRAVVNRHECTLDNVKPVVADVDGDGAKEAIGTVTCNGGTSDWPAEVLVVRGDGSTIGTASLGRPGHFHARATALTATASAVRVAWVTYDMGQEVDKPHTGTVGVRGAKVVVTDQARDTGTGATGRTTVVAPGRDASFLSPSGSIDCRLTSDSVRCDINGYTYTPSPAPSEDECMGDWGQSFGLSSDGTKGDFVCAGDPAYSPQGNEPTPQWFDPTVDSMATPGPYRGYAVGYGHTLKAGGISCVIDETAGVTCTTGAHGFTASKERYRTW